MPRKQATYEKIILNDLSLALLDLTDVNSRPLDRLYFRSPDLVMLVKLDHLIKDYQVKPYPLQSQVRYLPYYRRLITILGLSTLSPNMPYIQSSYYSMHLQCYTQKWAWMSV